VGLVTKRKRVEGGPGWYVDGQTLLPVIEDVELFRAALQDDPAVDVLVALWSGNPKRAETEIRQQLAERETPRLRALLADAWRDQGMTAEAVAAYEELVNQVVGTSHEAVMQQHLGKALFVAGRFDEAARAFETALGLRLETGADEHLVNSSRVALERAREAGAVGR
jgi:hypothetical protein